MTNLTKFDHIRSNSTVEFSQIQIKDQIRPQIRNSNSTFLIEFRIISSKVRNSSELNIIFTVNLNLKKTKTTLKPFKISYQYQTFYPVKYLRRCDIFKFLRINNRDRIT
jgi:hypothetical protein